QIGDVDIEMDLKFSSPQSDFKSLLSIVPGSYTKDFADVKADGKFDFNGYAKGVYNDQQYPEFKINLNIEEGKLQYPSLPMSISNINTKIGILSPQGQDFDMVQVNVPTLAMNIGNGNLKGYFYLKTPVSDPDIDTKLDGNINLNELSKAFPMESIKNLNGQISANIQAKTRMSYIDKKQYEKVNMAGALRVNNMRADATDMPSIQINNLAMNFTPNFVGIDNFTGQLGKSDIQANGKIDNILAYFSPGKTMKGNLKLRSNYFDAGEWLSDSPSSANNSKTVDSKTPPQTNKKPNADKPVFDRFDFSLDSKIGNLKYNEYNLLNTVAIGHFTSYTVDFKEMSTKIGNSDIKLNGKLDNVFNYLFDEQTLAGNIAVSSTYMDINQFMATTPPTASATKGAPAQTPENLEPLRIPHNMDLLLNANMKRVIYTNMDMTNLTGKVLVKNGVAKLVDTKANTLGGQIILNGGYDSNAEKPKFDLNYDIKNFEFQQAFATFNTFEKLAPIGKFIQGRFNSSLNMSGDLGKDMMPDLNSISLDGFIQTIKAIVSGLKPVQEIGNQLNIKELSNFEIKDTKNWLTVKNGLVSVSPFDVKMKDIAMNVSGSHGLNKEMNYVVKTKVPRKMLEKNVATSAANQGFNLITKEASKYGVNVKNGEFVNCQFTITGDILNPKVAFKLLGTDGQTVGETAKDAVNTTVEKAKDSIRTRVEQELQKAKDKGKEAAAKAADSLKNVANRQVDKAIEKGKEEVKGKIGEKATEVLGDEAGKKAKDALEKGKGAIDGLFKKKKKEN
ncbi:MAG: AsmA-like C-terminal region-containing protein, partial [Saprospiraceae bacterium]